MKDVYKKIRTTFWFLIKKYTPIVYPYAVKHRAVFKYITAGGTAAFVNLSVLYVLTDIVGIWYVISAVAAFSVALIVSFVFQKFWTFEDYSRQGVHNQAVLYLVVALTNLLINTTLIFFFVEYLGFHYIFGQILSGMFIAAESFFVYRKFVFTKQYHLKKDHEKFSF
jgi:dolichol-phosphate mannosyltransferase